MILFYLKATDPVMEHLKGLDNEEWVAYYIRYDTPQLKRLEGYSPDDVAKAKGILGDSLKTDDKLNARFAAAAETVKPEVRNMSDEEREKTIQEAERAAEEERKLQEEAEKKEREEAERQAKEEADRKAKEEAERKEAEAQAKEEAGRKAKEEADRKKKEEAERKKADAAAKKEAEAEATLEKARQISEDDWWAVKMKSEGARDLETKNIIRDKNTTPYDIHGVINVPIVFAGKQDAFKALLDSLLSEYPEIAKEAKNIVRKQWSNLPPVD